MTTPHARHLAEMRSTLPPRPVDDIPAIVSHLRHLVPWPAGAMLFALERDGDVTSGPLGWRLAGGAS